MDNKRIKTYNELVREAEAQTDEKLKEIIDEANMYSSYGSIASAVLLKRQQDRFKK